MAYDLDSLTAANALIGSLGMRASDARVPLHLPVPRLLQSLRTAQVELYCDHDNTALHVLRQAQHDLAEQLPPASPQLQAIEVAMWHVRRHELDEAQQAIALLNDQLAGVGH